MPRTAILPPVVVLCVLLISAAPVLGQGQAPTLGLEDLGLGDLGGMGGLGLLGALGGLGGGLSSAAPAPATIRGVQSEGMVLAAGDKKPLALVTLDRDCPPGTKVR